MFSFRKAKKVANLVIDDYAIRIVENSGNDLSSVKYIDERPIPPGIIKNGKVVDEILFYEFMKSIVKDWGIKNRPIRFYVPDSLVIMRHVSFPSSLEGDEVIDHFHLEIGQSLHLPFEKPIFDVYPHSFRLQSDEDEVEDVQHGTMFAVPEEDVRKYTEVIADVSLKPIAVDVRALGVYRYFHEMGYSNDTDVFLFFESNVTSISISIFHRHKLEFLRYQPFDFDLKLWVSDVREEGMTWQFEGDEEEMRAAVNDQISELERIINFYNFSMHKGRRNVTQIVVLGDHPDLYAAFQEIESRYTSAVTLLKAYENKEKIKEVGRQFIPALGLALKGGN